MKKIFALLLALVMTLSLGMIELEIPVIPLRCLFTDRKG